MRIRYIEKEDLVRQKAIELIVNEGFDEFRMQNPAKAAEISPATLYIYNKDRDDLLVKYCPSVFDDMVANSLKDFEVYWSVAFAPLYKLMKFPNRGLGAQRREVPDY